MESKRALIFVLDGKKEDKSSTKDNKKKKQTDGTDNCKNVKADLFGAKLKASAVRRSRNVSVLFDLRPRVL